MRFEHKISSRKFPAKLIFAFLPHKCKKCRDIIWLDNMIKSWYYGLNSFTCLKCYGNE